MLKYVISSALKWFIVSKSIRFFSIAEYICSRLNGVVTIGSLALYVNQSALFVKLYIVIVLITQIRRKKEIFGNFQWNRKHKNSSIEMISQMELPKRYTKERGRETHKKKKKINSNCLIEIANGMKCANENENMGKEMPKKNNPKLNDDDEWNTRRNTNVKISAWKFCLVWYLLLLLLLSLNGWCVFEVVFSYICYWMYFCYFFGAFALITFNGTRIQFMCVRECSFIFIPSHSIRIRNGWVCIAKMHWFGLWWISYRFYCHGKDYSMTTTWSGKNLIFKLNGIAHYMRAFYTKIIDFYKLCIEQFRKIHLFLC